MKLTRGSTLAGLVFVAIAAPVAAYAVANDDPGPGSPGTSHGRGHAYGHDKQHASEPEETPGTEDSDESSGTGNADESSGPGRAHADAMKAWAHCVADAASGPKAEGSPTPPKEACGDKPMPPGRAKHATQESPGRSGDHRSGHGRGHHD